MYLLAWLCLDMVPNEVPNEERALHASRRMGSTWALQAAAVQAAMPGADLRCRIDKVVPVGHWLLLTEAWTLHDLLQRRTMSCCGMPSVMQTTSSSSASMASMIALAAKGGGT